MALPSNGRTFCGPLKWSCWPVGRTPNRKFHPGNGSNGLPAFQFAARVNSSRPFCCPASYPTGRRLFSPNSEGRIRVPNEPGNRSRDKPRTTRNTRNQSGVTTLSGHKCLHPADEHAVLPKVFSFRVFRVFRGFNYGISDETRNPRAETILQPFRISAFGPLSGFGASEFGFPAESARRPCSTAVPDGQLEGCPHRPGLRSRYCGGWTDRIVRPASHPRG